MASRAETKDLILTLGDIVKTDASGALAEDLGLLGEV